MTRWKISKNPVSGFWTVLEVSEDKRVSRGFFTFTGALGFAIEACLMQAISRGLRIERTKPQ